MEQLSRSKLTDLTANDWILIDAKAKRLAFRIGEPIIREGCSIQHLFVIRSGSATVAIAGTTKKATIAKLTSGDVCGEIAFLGDSRATADVIAADEHVEVDAISATDLRDMVRTFPAFGVRFCRSLALILGQRLRDTSKELLRVMVLGR